MDDIASMRGVVELTNEIEVANPGGWGQPIGLVAAPLSWREMIRS